MLAARSAALDRRGQLEAEQRARAARASDVSEARLSALFDSLQTGCEHIGLDWRYLYVNEAAARRRGKPREELMGRLVMDAWPDAEASAEFGLFRRCMEERVACHQEIESVLPNGSLAWFDERAEPVPDGIFVFSVDISERRRALIRERARDAHYRALARHFPNGALLLFDRSLRYQLAEGAGLAELGLSAAELEGKTPHAVFPPALWAAVEADHRAALAGETRVSELSFAGRV